jgi:hypothetical protein
MKFQTVILNIGLCAIFLAASSLLSAQWVKVDSVPAGYLMPGSTHQVSISAI